MSDAPDVWSGVPAPWREAVQAFAASCQAVEREARGGTKRSLDMAFTDWRESLNALTEVLRAASREAQELRTEREKFFRWAYALNVALARRCLRDAHNDDGEWPQRMEWGDLVDTSRSIFLTQARDEAGIDHDAFLEPIRAGSVNVEDLYESGGVVGAPPETPAQPEPPVGDTI